MNRVFRTASALLMALSIPAAAAAEFRRIEIKALGMDWAVCAHAVRMAMKKLPGVETVDVSLATASTTLTLKAGNTVTLKQIRDIIKDSGFNARAATVTAVGKIGRQGERLVFDLAPAQTVLSMDVEKTAAGAVAEARKLAGTGTAVQVTGVVPQGDILTVATIKR